MPDPFHQSIAFLWIATAIAAGAPAAEPFYLGAWKIDSAVAAPWAVHDRNDDAEMKSLVGKTLAIKPKEIAGPGILACNGPHYRVKDFPADWLFHRPPSSNSSPDRPPPFWPSANAGEGIPVLPRVG